MKIKETKIKLYYQNIMFSSFVCVVISSTFFISCNFNLVASLYTFSQTKTLLFLEHLNINLSIKYAQTFISLCRLFKKILLLKFSSSNY